MEGVVYLQKRQVVGKGKEGAGFSGVMVTFMCQLGWAMVPRCVVKHYSGCFRKGVFQ